MTSRDDAISQAALLVATVGLPDPFSVRAFLNQVAQSRDKPIVLHRVEPGWCGSGGWCGAWLDTGVTDHIFFVQDLSTVKTAQTVLHEVGHVHRRPVGGPTTTVGELLDTWSWERAT